MKLQNPVLLTSRIEFDDDIQSKLTKTIEDMKKNLWKVPESRTDIEEKDSVWMVERDNNSPGSVALRKTDLRNFAMNFEGNLPNNMFYKVDKLYKESCEAEDPDDREYCSFHNFFLDFSKSFMEQPWYPEISCHLSTTDWVYDDDLGYIQTETHPDFIPFETLEGIVQIQYF